MRYGYGIPTPSGQSGGGSGSTSIPLRLKPVVAFASEYGWLNAIGEPAGYLESVSTLRNAGTGADGIQLTESSRPTCLAHDGENYLHLPGVDGNFASVPDGSELDITGDLNIEVSVPYGTGSGSMFFFVSKDAQSTGTQRSYNLIQYSIFGGAITCEWFDSGGNYKTQNSTAPLPTSATHVRWSLDVDNGVGGHDVKFYTSVDGEVWVQLGETITVAGVTDIRSSTAQVEIGAREGAQSFRGAIGRVRIYGSTDQSDKRLDVNFSSFAHNATSGVASTGQTVTINQNGGNMATIVGHPMLRFDGVDDRFTIPGVSITGPKTFVAVMRLASKANQLAWSVGNADAYAWGIESGLTSANTDSPPTGVAAYRKNGAPAAISNRDDLYDALQSQRVLLVSTYTFSSVAGDLDFGGVSTFGGLQLQGDIEKILAYPRILPNNEIEMLEAYLLG